MNDSATVVIPTLGRAGSAVATVRSVLEQGHDQMEILVVDQSDERDSELLHLENGHPDVITYRHVTFRGLPVARNYGWMNARHEAIIFIDDDVEVLPGFVGAHLEALQRDGVGLVGGRINDAGATSVGHAGPGHTGRFNIASAVADRGFNTDGFFEIDHVPGGNFSSWRNVLQQAGGFDERLGLGAALMEETELCLRVRKVGLTIVFCGSASLLHLRANAGGCRVPDIPDYVYSLAANRSVVIRRHVPQGFWPVALGRSLLYGLSYATAYRRPAAISSCLKGMIEGWRRGRLQPLCTGGNGSGR